MYYLFWSCVGYNVTRSGVARPLAGYAFVCCFDNGGFPFGPEMVLLVMSPTRGCVACACALPG